MRSGEHRRLIVIHAPAGFGKSTLAAQWCAVLAADGIPAAWLTVDEDDNHAVWFVAHLIDALRQVRPSLANELRQTLEEHGDGAERFVLTSMIDEIHRSHERVALVIDDWHRIAAPASVAALGFLIENSCHHLQIIVTTRTQAGLPLSRMRVRDELVEIDAAALRFNVSEAQAFLADRHSLVLDAEDVANLTFTTDGWVAALQLASLSLRGSANPATLISNISGGHHAIGEFLAENVLDSLKPALLDFLMATSVTERICGDLASELANVNRGQILLEEVESRDLFLSRLDEDDNWFQYHHLFADFLRRRLERDHPERIPVLHQSASRWFADHEMVSEAVDHALIAGDVERAVDLVEQGGIKLLERSQMATFLALIAKLPHDAVVQRSRLELIIASANLLLGDTESARFALDLVNTALQRDGFGTDEAPDLRVSADVLMASMNILEDRTDGAEALLAEAFTRPQTLPQWVVSWAAGVASFVDIFQFDFAAARRRQKWASAYQRPSNGPFGVIYGHCVAGIAAYEQLDIEAADESFQTALRLARETLGNRSYAARLAGALLGQLRYEQGNIDEAERLLDASVELGSAVGVVDFMIATYATGARVKASRLDHESAIRRLDEGARVASARSLPRLTASVEHERVRLGYNAFRESSPRGVPDSRSVADRSRKAGAELVTSEIEAASSIRRSLEESRDQVEIACSRAAELVGELRGQQRPRALLNANLLLAVCLAAAGRTAEAKDVLVPNLAQCAKLGLIRPVVDEGQRMTAILYGLQEDQLAHRWSEGWQPIPQEFLGRLLSSDGGPVGR